MWRFASLVAGGLFLTLGACSSDLNFDRDLEDMVCDSTGCWHCDGGECGEYRCNETHQCPIGRVCSADKRCLPGTDEPTGDACTRHEDCRRGEICTLDGICVTSPGGGPGVTEPDASGGDTAGGGGDTSGGDDDTTGGGDDTTGGGDDTTGGGDDVGLPQHPDDACTHNKDCGLDGICLNGGCYFGCAADASCPPGQLCSDGQCLPRDTPENTCTFNGECGPSRLCLEGTCYRTCSESLDCPAHTRCADGVCVADTSPAIQCSGPGSCDDGQGCVDGKCLDACGPGGTCAATEACQFGFCHAVPACFDQNDCAGANCLDGQCS